MEKRAILAAVLMAALLIAYQTFFFQPSPPAPQQQPPQQSAPASQPAPGPATSGAAAAPPEPPSSQQATARQPERRAVVETPLYKAGVSSEGGKLLEWTLKYRGQKPLVLPDELGPTGLVIAPQAGAPGEVVSMTLSAEKLDVPPGQSGDLVLNGEVQGLRVRETLKFQWDDFSVTVAIRIENVSSRPRTIDVSLPWVFREPWKEPAEKFAGQRPVEVVWAVDSRIEREANLSGIGARTIEGRWIALDSVWYITALEPQAPGFRLFARSEGKLDPAGKSGNGQLTIGVGASPTIGPGQAWEGPVLIYAGPKQYERLKAHGLEGTINFGGFPVPRRYGGLPMEWLGVPILLLLKWVYQFVGNYGVAIILLTLISKLVFYPLTVKSMRSMKAMQALQPQVNSLRAKLKDDPQRLQRETLELYRKYNVNPMGGCLPMVAQIPIFYALYLALSVSVELQNAPFICFGRAFGVDLWICDLAGHDPTYILPILMGISMFLQQKMTPTMGDPRQAKMMLVMPFVFTFMFLNLPSGLVLYWFVSNVLQILQQWFMDRSKRLPSSGSRDGKHAGKA